MCTSLSWNYIDKKSRILPAAWNFCWIGFESSKLYETISFLAFLWNTSLAASDICYPPAFLFQHPYSTSWIYWVESERLRFSLFFQSVNFFLERTNSVPTVISWLRFLHVKIMWIYDMVFWCSNAKRDVTFLSTVSKTYFLKRLHKNNTVKYIYTHQQQQQHRYNYNRHSPRSSAKFCNFTKPYGVRSKSQNLCINMYVNGELIWMC